MRRCPRSVDGVLWCCRHRCRQHGRDTKIPGVAYYLTFFCRAGEENGSSALARFLATLAESGNPLLVERRTGDYVYEVSVCELATDDGSGRPVADWLSLEFSVGVEFIAESVIEVSPNDEYGIWGSDLHAQIALSGNSPDWPLVDRIWTTLVGLWSAVAWDGMSGFEINNDAPKRA